MSFESYFHMAYFFLSFRLILLSCSVIHKIFFHISFMYHMYVSCHVATTIVIMNVVYFVYLLLSFLFFFRSFFLLQPFLSASSV